MKVGPGPGAARLASDLKVPVLGALLVTGFVRLLWSVQRACEVLQCDDFGRFWYATSAWRIHGTSLYALTPASVADDGLVYTNLNLPHTHLLFVPFTWLGRDLAAAVWLLTGIASLAASLMVIHKESGWRPTWGWVAVFLWWMPTHVQAVTGQIAWLLLLPMTLAWADARRNRWAYAGAWIGVATAIKPFLAPLLIWLVWRREWRAIGAAVAASLIVFAVGLVTFGVDSYADWRHVVGGVDWYARPVNASMWGGVYRAFTVNPRFASVVDLGHGALWLTAILGAIVAMATWGRCRQLRELDAEWTIVLTATLLICPLGWVYYGCLLLPGWRARWPGILATACWLVPTPWITAGQPSALATVLWGSTATWGLLLAWWHTMRTA